MDISNLFFSFYDMLTQWSEKDVPKNQPSVPQSIPVKNCFYDKNASHRLKLTDKVPPLKVPPLPFDWYKNQQPHKFGGQYNFGPENGRQNGPVASSINSPETVVIAGGSKLPGNSNATQPDLVANVNPKLHTGELFPRNSSKNVMGLKVVFPSWIGEPVKLNRDKKLEARTAIAFDWNPFQQKRFVFIDLENANDPNSKMVVNFLSQADLLITAKDSPPVIKDMDKAKNLISDLFNDLEYGRKLNVDGNVYDLNDKKNLWMVEVLTKKKLLRDDSSVPKKNQASAREIIVKAQTQADSDGPVSEHISISKAIIPFSRSSAFDKSAYYIAYKVNQFATEFANSQNAVKTITLFVTDALRHHPAVKDQLLAGGLDKAKEMGLDELFTKYSVKVQFDFYTRQQQEEDQQLQKEDQQLRIDKQGSVFEKQLTALEPGDIVNLAVEIKQFVDFALNSPPEIKDGLFAKGLAIAKAKECGDLFTFLGFHEQFSMFNYSSEHIDRMANSLTDLAHSYSTHPTLYQEKTPEKLKDLAANFGMHPDFLKDLYWCVGQLSTYNRAMAEKNSKTAEVAKMARILRDVRENPDVHPIFKEVMIAAMRNAVARNSKAVEIFNLVNEGLCQEVYRPHLDSLEKSQTETEAKNHLIAFIRDVLWAPLPINTDKEILINKGRQVCDERRWHFFSEVQDIVNYEVNVLSQFRNELVHCQNDADDKSKAISRFLEHVFSEDVNVLSKDFLLNQASSIANAHECLSEFGNQKARLEGRIPPGFPPLECSEHRRQTSGLQQKELKGNDSDFFFHVPK